MPRHISGEILQLVVSLSRKGRQEVDIARQMISTPRERW